MRTIARKKFKERFGQANHLLITSLIGLNGIETGEITKKPDEFSTSWNPQDKKGSARRTRQYVLDSFLGYAVDSIDMYLILLYRKPKFHFSEKLETIYSAAGRSVYRKALDVGDYYNIDPITRAMIDVLITWRNNIFHFAADNNLEETTKKTIDREKDKISKLFCGLVVDHIIDKSEKGLPFTFKEAASLIRATHSFVEEIDRKVLESLDFEEFSKELILNKLKSDMQFRKQYFQFESDRRDKYLINFLLQETGLPFDGFLTKSNCIKIHECKAT